ncbi:MAG: hypothetical protein GYA24_16015 [Candidatus Lokiarchaeota archaeon]|nr:hypothetical protein [Candidatus Lokiarchaeota archaeon]
MTNTVSSRARSRAVLAACIGPAWDQDGEGKVKNGLRVRFDQWLVRHLTGGVAAGSGAHFYGQDLQYPRGTTNDQGTMNAAAAARVDGIQHPAVLALLGITSGGVVDPDVAFAWHLVYDAKGGNREFDASGAPISFAIWCERNHGYDPGAGQTFLAFLQGKDEAWVRQQFLTYAFLEGVGYIVPITKKP